jgi:hypothetical protein
MELEQIENILDGLWTRVDWSIHPQLMPSMLNQGYVRCHTEPFRRPDNLRMFLPNAF